MNAYVPTARRRRVDRRLGRLAAAGQRRIAGISGILGGLLGPSVRDGAWRTAFVIGLLAGPALFSPRRGPLAGGPGRRVLAGARRRRAPRRLRDAPRLGLHQRPRRLRPRAALAPLPRGGGDLHGGGHRHRLPRPSRSGPMTAPRLLAALASGLLFGAGLALSGMMDPEKVLGFLDLAGAWDPSLAFVLGGAVGVSALGYALKARMDRPALADRFAVRRTAASMPASSAARPVRHRLGPRRILPRPGACRPHPRLAAGRPVRGGDARRDGALSAHHRPAGGTLTREAPTPRDGGAPARAPRADSGRSEAGWSGR